MQGIDRTSAAVILLIALVPIAAYILFRPADNGLPPRVATPAAGGAANEPPKRVDPGHRDHIPTKQPVPDILPESSAEIARAGPRLLTEAVAQVREPTANAAPVCPTTREQRQAFIDIILKPHIDGNPPHLLAQERIRRHRERLRSDLSFEQQRETAALLDDLFKEDLTNRLLTMTAVEHYVMNAPDLAAPARRPGGDGKHWQIARGLLDMERQMFGDAATLKVQAWLDYATYPDLGASAARLKGIRERLRPFER